MVLRTNGSVWATGRNNWGQIGDRGSTDNVDFTLVFPGDVIAIAAGANHSMVLKNDGSVWATGRNHYGQLGDGSTTDRNEFSKAISDAKAIAAGENHSMVLKKDGSVWATGRNYDCLLYTSPSPRDRQKSRMPSSA